MHTCPICSRSYSTRNSLTRHIHNHRQGTHHFCSVCGTSFRRRDLLTRHSRIHASIPNNNSSLSDSSRSRCHTACLHCRKLRVRCDGDAPCSSCVQLNRSCTYSTESRRISQRGASGPQENHLDMSKTDQGYQPAVMHNAVSVLGKAAPQPICEAQGYVADDYDLSILDPADITMLPATFDDNYGPVGSGFTSHDWPEPAQRSWPWLHENMFFQDLMDDSVQFQPEVRARQPLQEQQPCHQTSFNMAESNVLCADNGPASSDHMSTVPMSSSVTIDILGSRQSGMQSFASFSDRSHSNRSQAMAQQPRCKPAVSKLWSRRSWIPAHQLSDMLILEPNSGLNRAGWSIWPSVREMVLGYIATAARIFWNITSTYTSDISITCGLCALIPVVAINKSIPCSTWP